MAIISCSCSNNSFTMATTMGKAQQDLLAKLGTNIETGLSRDEASKRRQEGDAFNVVDPPINCPAWVCCLLPCIKSIPSMKKFREIQPEDAEVLREGRWVRYDAASLVSGDIIRLVSHDCVPADCVMLSLDAGEDEMLIDVRAVTGEDKPRSIIPNDEGVVLPMKLYYGGSVLQGSGIAVVTAVGPNTLLASLIRNKKFPPKERVLIAEDEEAGVPLVGDTENRII